MGRNQQSVSIGHHEEQQGNKQRDHDRQQRHIGQDERRVILRNGAGPVDEGPGASVQRATACVSTTPAACTERASTGA